MSTLCCPGCGQQVATEKNAKGAEIWSYHDQTPPFRALCPASQEYIGVKVHVTFTDDRPTPRMAGEYLWAKPTDRPHHFALDNVPFFADLAVGDVVRVSMAVPAEKCVHGPDCEYCRAREVVEVTEPTGHATLRMLFGDDLSVDDRRKVNTTLVDIGLSHVEWADSRLMAVDIPPTQRIDALIEALPEHLRNVECDLADA